jgi:hypothetical protein
MRTELRVGCLLAFAGLAAPLHAQDSVSTVGALPGDAVDAYKLSEQLNTYVVDLTPRLSSWNTPFGVAPLVKLSRSIAPGSFYTHLASANATSNDVLTGTGFAFESYDVWNTPGQGVNDQTNAPGQSIDATGLTGVQFGYLAAEFEGNDGNIIAGTVNYEASNPARLYVSRIVAAQNGAFQEENTAQYGTGSVDASGNVAFRGDDFGVTGPNGITGNNYYRVNIFDRDYGAINKIDNSGFTDTGDWIVQNSGTTHAVPNLIPESVAGRPVMAGTDFLGQYVYEQSAGTTVQTTAHLVDYQDHRGTAGYSPISVFDGSVATLTMFGLDVGAPLDDDLDSILVWGVDANGNVVDAVRVPFPDSITDNDDGFNTNATTFGLIDPLRGGNFGSQVVFRGGNGQSTLGYDTDGNLLLATHVQIANPAFGGDPDLYDTNPINCIAVARFPDGDITADPEWTLAGYTAWITSGNSKSILDGKDGIAVGRQLELLWLTGGNPLGPSMTSPMIDAAGNIYFISTVQFFVNGADDPGNIVDDDIDNALVRAVYDADSFSYQLDAIVALGNVFDGMNSGTPWQVNFIDLVDSNSVGSAAPFTGNIVPGAAGGMDPSSLEQDDARNLGGLIFSSRIVYDTNGDEDFDTATDENYRVMVYVGAIQPAVGGCPADCDGNGVLNILDFVCFQGEWQDQTAFGDCDDNGQYNILDFVCYQGAFQEGCD